MGGDEEAVLSGDAAIGFELGEDAAESFTPHLEAWSQLRRSTWRSRPAAAPPAPIACAPHARPVCTVRRSGRNGAE